MINIRKNNLWTLFVIIMILFANCYRATRDRNSIDDNTEFETISVAEKKETQNTSYNSMNNANALRILLPNNKGGNEEIYLENDFGNYAYDYNMNRVAVSYFNRDIKFDSLFRYNNSYDIDFFSSLNHGIYNNITTFSHWYFHNNIRKNVRNDIVTVDSFRFCVIEEHDQRLNRTLFISFSNYDIIIYLYVTMDKVDEIYSRIAAEAPDYFDIDLNESNPEYVIRWNTLDSIINFGTDLLNGNNRSKSVIEWYNETEEILRGLRIIYN